MLEGDNGPAGPLFLSRMGQRRGAVEGEPKHGILRRECHCKCATSGAEPGAIAVGKDRYGVPLWRPAMAPRVGGAERIAVGKDRYGAPGGAEPSE